MNRYTDLITRQHAHRPKFNALVESTTGAFDDLGDFYKQLCTAFDIDTAVGAQLDAVGAWIGIGRNIEAPQEDVFFTWGDYDAPTSTGWGYGVWLGQYQNRSSIKTLPDDVYRRVLKAKIKANMWDGSTEGLYEILEEGFSAEGAEFRVIDHEDMSISIVVNGTISALSRAILTAGYLPIKPAGVSIRGFTFNS